MRATAIKTENIVLTTVTLRHGSVKGVAAMNKEYFDAVCSYKSVMAQARLMLFKGFLTEGEYALINTTMAEKYGLSCSLFRENDLLYKEKDGNMSHYKEVTECKKQ